MSRDERVLHLVRYLRQVMDHLDLPEDFIAAVDRLLAQGPEAAPALEELLARHPVTRGWMREALWPRALRYRPLPGEPASPPARGYCCPVAGCPTPPYIPFQAGEPIPPCPLHGEDLVECGEGR